MIIKKRKTQLVNSVNNQLIESVYLDENNRRVFLKIPVSFNNKDELLKLKKLRFYFVKKDFYIKEDFTNSTNLTSSDFYTVKREAKTNNTESKLKIKAKYRDINNIDIFRYNAEISLSETDLDIIRFSGSYVFYVPLEQIDQSLTHFRITLLGENNKTLSYVNPIGFDQNRNVAYYINNAQPEDYIEITRRKIISALDTINITYVPNVETGRTQRLGISDYSFQFSLNQLNPNDFDKLEVFISYKEYSSNYVFEEFEENIFLLNNNTDEIEEEIARNRINNEELQELVITFNFTLKNLEKTVISYTIDKELPENVVVFIADIYEKSISNAISEEISINCEILDDEAYYSSYVFTINSESDLDLITVNKIKINDQEINKISTSLNQRDIEKLSYKNQSINKINNKKIYNTAALRNNIVEIQYSVFSESYTETFNIKSTVKRLYKGFYAKDVKDLYDLFTLNSSFLLNKNKSASGIENYNIISSKIRNIDSFSELARKFGYISESGEVQTTIFLKNIIFGIQSNLYINNNYVYSKESFCFLNKVYNLVENNETNISEFSSNNKFNQEFNSFDKITNIVNNKFKNKSFKNKVKDINSVLSTNKFNIANTISKENNTNSLLRYEHFVYILPLSKNIFSSLNKGLDSNNNILNTVNNYNIANKEFNDIVYSVIPSTSKETFNSYKKAFFSLNADKSYSYDSFTKDILNSILTRKQLNIINKVYNINDITKFVEEKFNKKVENKYTLLSKSKTKNVRPDIGEDNLDITALDTDIDFIENNGNIIMTNDLSKDNLQYGKSFILLDISSLLDLSDTKDLIFKNASFDIHPVCFKKISNKVIDNAVKESKLKEEIFISDNSAFYTDKEYKKIFKTNTFKISRLNKNNKQMLLLKLQSAYADNTNLYLYIRKLESLGYSEIKGFTIKIKINLEIKNAIDTNNNKNIDILKSISFNLNSNIENALSFSSQLQLEENKNNSLQSANIKNIINENSRIENKIIAENIKEIRKNKINSLNKQII